jgi:hypothetical protein
MSTLLEKIKSLKLCLMAHPDNEEYSEFADRISDLEEIENELSKDTETQQSCITSVKSRFFAQYWGQDVCQKKGGSYLKLKPLSKITDEDAIEIIKIIDLKSNRFINVNYSYAEKKQLPYIKSVISDKGRFDINDNFYLIIDNQLIEFSLNIFDFLRSKGYAVPFMEYSVDELINLGWVLLV